MNINELKLRYSYTIAFSMRSGSNELCNMLNRNNVGAPSEFFQTWEPFNPATDVPSLDKFRSVIAQNQKMGVFGSKMSHDHRARLDGHLAHSVRGYCTLDDVLPNHRWVWLVRRDKIAQAISLCRAEHSGVWAVDQSDPAHARHWRYNFPDVLDRLSSLMVSDFAWETYFATYKIIPYKIIYEDFFADPKQNFLNLVRYLSDDLATLNPAALDFSPTLSVQRDSLSQYYHELFRKHLNRVGDLDLDAPSSFIAQPNSPLINNPRAADEPSSSQFAQGWHSG